jgi:hypothetical protein
MRRGTGRFFNPGANVEDRVADAALEALRADAT